MHIESLVHLWNITQEHPGTSTAKAAAGVLLGLYNGRRFPMDLTDLRLLDDDHLKAAISVIRADATRCQMEVHSWLNQISGRRDFGMRFEHLAHDYNLKGRGNVSALDNLSPEVLIVRTSNYQTVA